jgi:hypothetical protein
MITEFQRKVLSSLGVAKTRYDVMAEFKLSLVSATTVLRKLVAAGLAVQYRGDPKGKGPPNMVFVKKDMGEKDGKNDNVKAELAAVPERPEGNPQ